MQLSLIGGRDLVLPEGWTSESSFTVLGGADIDATARPGDGATIRAFSIIGAINVRVPRDARTKLAGGTLVGGRQVDPPTGNGPEIKVVACTLLGRVRVTHGS